MVAASLGLLIRFAFVQLRGLADRGNGVGDPDILDRVLNGIASAKGPLHHSIGRKPLHLSASCCASVCAWRKLSRPKCRQVNGLPEAFAFQSSYEVLPSFVTLEQE